MSEQVFNTEFIAGNSPEDIKPTTENGVVEVLVDLSDRRALAMSLVEAFGNSHMTLVRSIAAELVLDIPSNVETAERDKYIDQFLEERGYGVSEAQADRAVRMARDVIVSIAEDYRVLQEAFDAYAQKLEGASPEVAALLRLDDDAPIPQGMWTKDERDIMPMPDLEDLINTFSTKGNKAQGIGLETAMIAGAITVADLMTTPYQAVKAYKSAVFARNILAPICSIIGMDALESAMRDEVDIIAGRNIGDAVSADGTRTGLSGVIDSLLDEVDRVVSLHFGRRHSQDPTRFDFAIANTTGIVRELFNKADSTGMDLQLKPAIRVDAPHGMFFQVGSIITPEQDKLQIRVRGKGRGSYARKLLKSLGYYENRLTPPPEMCDIHPIDLYGSTIVTGDNHQLAGMYAAAVVNAMRSEAITLYPAPNRSEAVCIVKGPREFQQLVRQAVAALLDNQSGSDVQLADIESLFDFSESASGFTDAKITGMYQTGHARVAFAPFEMQFSTPPARLNARLGGRAAHFLFKLRGLYGDKIGELPDELLRAVEDIWCRKQEYFNSVNEAANEHHLTTQSRRRIGAFEQRLQTYGATHQKVGQCALGAVY
ncbi:MAG: hypothetical protein Q4A34_02370 [Candidatus Saccharibacteria bacterium]|nr:hypothetical protein [Candidatus Saccharibacteria bacterium]